MRLIIADNFRPFDQMSDDCDELVFAQDLVDEFLRFVKANDIGNDMVDEVELPVAKPRLVRAFCRVIVAERRPEVRSLLIKAALTLAQYRSDLGSRIRIRSGFPGKEPTPRGSRRLARRFERALLGAAEERVRLSDTLLQAIRRSLN